MRRLHIGGHTPLQGWEVIDANPGPVVDHVGNAGDLPRFETGTFSEVYASHVLEHYHAVGLNEEFLRDYFRLAGFVSAARVTEFGICADTSTMQVKGVPISLNMTALKGAAQA